MDNIQEVVHISDELRVNEEIRARKIRLIDTDGNQIGIVSREKALDEAFDKGLDLVEVAPSADPVVCRIMDYGKYKYEKQKQRQEARRKADTIQVKELELGMKIADHDLNTKLRHARRFLNDGDKVKVRIPFRGREIVHKDRGRDMMDRVIEELSDLGEVEEEPSMEGRNMIALISPK